MKFLCPTCRTPLPLAAAAAVVPCSQCGVAVDLTRIDTSPGSSALSPEVDLTGETLGAFKLGAQLGTGGMGAVYEAVGPQGRCAVKVLATTLGAEPSLRARFRREASALRALDHPGVVRVLDEGEERGFCWYAMERVDGPDLRMRLRDGPMASREVEKLARELLSALEAVHGRGLVHRDVKPGNILLSAHGAKLCDFGIARFDGSTTLTESAALMGSLRYMAPEQRRGRADASSDLYALGLVLHESLVGRLPDEATLGRTAPRLRRLITALLRDKPEERPASAKAASAWLSAPVWRTRPWATATVALALAVVGGTAGLLRVPAQRALIQKDAAPRVQPQQQQLDERPVQVQVDPPPNPLESNAPKPVKSRPEKPIFVNAAAPVSTKLVRSGGKGKKSPAPSKKVVDLAAEKGTVAQLPTKAQSVNFEDSPPPVQQESQQQVKSVNPKLLRLQAQQQALQAPPPQQVSQQPPQVQSANQAPQQAPPSQNANQAPEDAPESAPPVKKGKPYSTK